MKRGNFYFELGRKLFHLFFGLSLIFILTYLGRANLIVFLSLFLIAGCIMIILMKQGRRIPVAGWFEAKFEREDVRFPGYGAFWFVVGALLIALSLSDADEISAALMVLAAGDGAATIFGVKGCHLLPHNRLKTMEGSVAFFVSSLSACIFVGWMGVALALLGAVVEGLATPVDDNLLIPVAAILFFMLI
jgi:dolichol kinase